MATILLSAAGAALGGSLGGTVAGLSTAIVGRAIGATLGNVIDQRLMGAGAEPVEQGKVDRFRLSQAGDGAPATQVFGRMRVGGQVIWASDFQETVTTAGGGKGAPSSPAVSQYSYSVSLAIALCKGQIASVGRVWADGEEVSPDDLAMRVYSGAADQLPDPLMEAVEGEGLVPAYRGTAYVVMENLNLEQFGNRVPQFSFEVVRGEQPEGSGAVDDPAQSIRGVALVPGTGEYSLATTPVYYSSGPAAQQAANINSPSGKTDLVTSVEALGAEVPNCSATSLVVSWFGDDLRCGACTVRPKVETQFEGSQPWSVSGLGRSAVQVIAQVDDRPIYGGTPSDASVVEAIRHLNEVGQGVMFYPFILMDQQEANGLPDPWTGGDDQPALPWRGRITLSVAPGQAGTPDGTSTADTEVAAFFGTASAADFTVGDGAVTYNGPAEWGLRRFILHYAALCAAAGGVEAFCIGSEMRGLTQIRGAGGGFAAVAALRDLAAEVRGLLGADCKIGYAADWSEYFGYQPDDGSGDRFFHLDLLWADANIDFVGIDNYMPLSDWRDGPEHLDAGAGTIYDLDYLRGNIEGGEGYDWYYHSPEARAAQIRTKITDDEGEPWIWRYKDIRNWWTQPHHDRIGGLRQAQPTAWVPQSKPIWFTELGCAAVDKGTNEPNKFLDPKSSESALPRYSSGARDDLIQSQYLRAMLGYWGNAANNPVSVEYGGPMIDLAHAYVWAWDARPFPFFPNATEVWSDGENYARGHWINGRIGGRTLASVVEELCRSAGLNDIDLSELHGFVRGYVLEDVANARAALQPLMLRYGFDAVERDGLLRFVPRDGQVDHVLAVETLAESEDLEAPHEYARAGEAEMTGRIRLRFAQADADHALVAEEAVRPEDATHAVATTDLALSMTRGEGRAVAERWLAEARVSRDGLRFALPPSALTVRAGDVVQLAGGGGLDSARYRVDRAEVSDRQVLEAVRIEPEVYRPLDAGSDLAGVSGFVPPLPVTPLFMDLPLMAGDEVEHAPHLAVTADPWGGSAAVYASASDEDYTLDRVLMARSVVGITETTLPRHPAGRWDLGGPLQVRLISGALESRSREAVLNGANLAAIGDGSSGNWELFQFETAELVDAKTWWLSGRLRGQLGSDALMSQDWPEGSWFVLLNGVPEQIGLSPSLLRVARHYRIGPASRPASDPSYVHRVEAFNGNGLRPYAPAHLCAVRSGGGDLVLNWIRRTRIDGDSWDLAEVPLGEESETYLLRVRQGTAVLREVTLGAPGWSYAAVQQEADGAVAGDVIEVAQVSARYGPGLFAQVVIPA